MLKIDQILFFRKQLAFSLLFIGAAAFSFASMGRGGGKPKTSLFTPLKSTGLFTLKAGPSYHGSTIFNEVKTNNSILFSSIVTYQKGNTTYILPYKHRVSVSAGKSTLQLVNVGVSIHR